MLVIIGTNLTGIHLIGISASLSQTHKTNAGMVSWDPTRPASYFLFPCATERVK